MKILSPEALRAAARPALSPAPQPASLAPARPAGASFGEVLARLGRRIDANEEAVNRAASGRRASMDAGDMLALQAQVYRYVEAVDLASKLVDRATSAVKTTLQGQ